MHCNWINGMKTLSLPILIIFILSIKENHVKAAAFNVDDGQLDEFQQEAVKRAGGWHNLQGGWGKRNNEISTDYEEKPSADYVDLVRNYDYDTSKVESNGDHWNYDYGKNAVFKRSRPNNWNNLQNAGWGKREPGQWNNLRGLWGKRSSWGKLQGGWGRK